jgi:ribose 5-phosphate isomerase B
MRIYIGADHAGFSLKNSLKIFLESEGHEVIDKGAYLMDEHDDYPDVVFPVVHAVASEPGSFGVVIGGSGQGEAITANRVRGVRAVVFYGSRLEIVPLAREHNDANVLSLGARFIDEGEAIEAVKLFLSTTFSGDERHVRRIEKLDNHG